MPFISHLIRSTLFAASSLLILPAIAQTAEISRFNTIHGEVIHQEAPGGRATLKFVTKGNLVSLPSTWGRVAVEQVTALNGQTAILMSHSDASCPSRMSLAVVSRDTFWGPYSVGGCEDILVHQRSADGNDLIAMRADSGGGLAWVYSAADSRFRGPVAVKLPRGMSEMVPPIEAAPAPQPKRSSAMKVPSTPSAVPTAESLDAGEKVVSVRKPAAPVKTAITPEEAAAVAAQTRKAPPAKVLSINL